MDQASLASLHAEAVQLERLADDLYQLAMVDIGTLTYRKESLNLTALLKEVCHSFEDIFNTKGIALSCSNKTRGALFVFGDPTRLRQLCTNLLENSLKYTDSGGRCCVKLFNIDGRAVLDFQDTSPGVDRDILERLLDRFYRAPQHEETPNGVGLGLSICRKIVEGHQGEITLKNSLLGGLTVRIELPIRGASS
jgi:two-component system sensor histidine kinase BaeS